MKEPVMLEAIVPSSSVADSRIAVDVENDDDDDKYYPYYDSSDFRIEPHNLNSSDASPFLSAAALGHGFVSPKDVVVIIFVLCLWLYSIGLMFRAWNRILNFSEDQLRSRPERTILLWRWVLSHILLQKRSQEEQKSASGVGGGNSKKGSATPSLQGDGESDRNDDCEKGERGEGFRANLVSSSAKCDYHEEEEEEARSSKKTKKQKRSRKMGRAERGSSSKKHRKAERCTADNQLLVEAEIPPLPQEAEEEGEEVQLPEERQLTKEAATSTKRLLPRRHTQHHLYPVYPANQNKNSPTQRHHLHSGEQCCGYRPSQAAPPTPPPPAHPRRQSTSLALFKLQEASAELVATPTAAGHLERMRRKSLRQDNLTLSNKRSSRTTRRGCPPPLSACGRQLSVGSALVRSEDGANKVYEL